MRLGRVGVRGVCVCVTVCACVLRERACVPQLALLGGGAVGLICCGTGRRREVRGERRRHLLERHVQLRRVLHGGHP